MPATIIKHPKLTLVPERALSNAVAAAQDEGVNPGVREVRFGSASQIRNRKPVDVHEGVANGLSPVVREAIVRFRPAGELFNSH